MKLKQDSKAVKEQESDAKEQRSAQFQFTAEQKAVIVARIKKEVEFEEVSREDFMSIRVDSMKLYEGIREPKSDPWPNCSNITTMLTAAHSKLMHARLLPAVWNTNLLYWRPAEMGDIANVENVKKFMDWVVRQDIGMQNIVDNGVNDAVVNGTVIFKVRWVSEWKWVMERTLEGHSITDSNPVYSSKYVYKKYEKAVVDLLEIEDYLQSGPDEQKCSYILHSTYHTLPDLKDMERKGVFIKGTITNELEAKSDERVKDGVRDIKEQAEGYHRSEALKNTSPIRLVERHGKWEVPDSNGGTQVVECVFTIAYESGVYLSGKPLAAVNRIGRRPFVVGPLIPRTNRIFGVGVPELLRYLQREIDAIHNQRIDAGSISVAPFGVYRAASSVRPENIQIGPGVLIPVDDIKDINLMQFPANFAFSYQEERLIIEYIEKLTVMSAYSFGQESNIVKSRATATSTLALMGQSDQAFTILGLRMQETISRLLTMILQYYQMYMPPTLANRVLGQTTEGLGLLFDEKLDVDTIAGNYDAYMELDASGGNKAMEQQVAQVLLQNAQGLLQLAQNPYGWEIAKRFLKSVGVLDVEIIIGPKPQQQTSVLPPGVEQPAQTGDGQMAAIKQAMDQQGTEAQPAEQTSGLQNAS